MATAERLCSDILLINKSRKVVSGTIREVKKSFGKNLIALRATGGEAVLADTNLVAKIVEHTDEKELVLADNVESQTLLKELVSSGATISKFEEIEPSLNDIFIEKVRGNS